MSERPGTRGEKQISLEAVGVVVGCGSDVGCCEWHHKFYHRDTEDTEKLAAARRARRRPRRWHTDTTDADGYSRIFRGGFVVCSLEVFPWWRPNKSSRCIAAAPREKPSSFLTLPHHHHLHTITSTSPLLHHHHHQPHHQPPRRLGHFIGSPERAVIKFK